MPIFPWPVCPLAGHARLGQHVVAGSMMSLLEWLCWRAYQEGVCLNPHFHCKRTSPRFSGELPYRTVTHQTLFVGNLNGAGQVQRLAGWGHALPKNVFLVRGVPEV